MEVWYNYEWKRGRVVEGARLEIVWAFTRLGGSNPLASAKLENTQGAVSSLAGEAITKTPGVLVLFFEKEDSLGSRCA